MGDRVLCQVCAGSLKSLEAGIEFLPGVSRPCNQEVIIGTPDGDVRIQAATVIWTSTCSQPFLLAEATGCEVDRGGRERTAFRSLNARDPCGQ